MNNDGACAKGYRYVHVVSRSLDPIPDDVVPRLKQAVRDTCLERGDLEETHHFRS